MGGRKVMIAVVVARIRIRAELPRLEVDKASIRSRGSKTVLGLKS